MEIGLHLALEPIQLSDEEESSDQQLAPEDAKALLSFYRNSPRYRGTRRHALLEVIWHTGCRYSGVVALDVELTPAD